MTCPSVDPESGRRCILLDDPKVHALVHVAGYGDVGWPISVEEFRRWHSPLAELANASARILRLHRELERARAQRDAALVKIHKGGVRKRHVAEVACEYLRLHGFSGEDLTRLALSPASVRLVLGTHRSPVHAEPIPPVQD